jgi:hypothetical protein
VSDASEEAIRRGKRAEALINDPMLQDAFKTLLEGYQQAWRDSAPRDTEGRERLYTAVHIVGKVNDHLRLAADNGKVAAASIAEVERLGERKGWFT